MLRISIGGLQDLALDGNNHLLLIQRHPDRPHDATMETMADLGPCTHRKLDAMIYALNQLHVHAEG